MASFFTFRQQTASKPYKCEVCGKTIPAGEKYEYRFWKEGNDTFSSRLHLDCAQAVDDYCRENDYDEYDIGAMRQNFIEQKCSVCSNHKGRCKPNRHCWCEKFKEDKQNGK
ncbi:MAG: hypothetical protein OSJ43_06780 [Oscillospiraceae bacterium]|nr:hypothetical protein [Oscillospiraceae bacterium]